MSRRLKTLYDSPNPMNTISVVKTLMTGFVESTGLGDVDKSPRRYLWTDAFAVCNFITLYETTGDERWRRSAVRLVDQVHHTLGRHREDDPRTGWISGLGQEEGEAHPTFGGLRIGKAMNERKPAEPYSDRLEWDRDGQYYHYLTKWMHALNRMSRLMEKPIYNTWAIELAKAAHKGFVRFLPDGSKGMCWKMSIDLSYPLVPFMGQHDPLDGLITYKTLQLTAQEVSKAPDLNLNAEIADMEAICKGENWTTDDPLGIGGILGDAYRILQLILKNGFTNTTLMNDLLKAALDGLAGIVEDGLLYLPAEYRLAFRELGLSIGLHAVPQIMKTIEKRPHLFVPTHLVHSRLNRLSRYIDLIDTIERFWLEPQSRRAQTWIEHRDINTVMLATSLAPDGFL